MDNNDNLEFVKRLTACQSALYAFIVTLMGGSDQAQDVLQETNLVLWEKMKEYDALRPFEAWACVFARFQVMAWRKKKSRGREILDDGLADKIADDMTGDTVPGDRRLEALEGCLKKLPDGQRAMIDARYGKHEAVQSIAEKMGKEPSAVAAALYRIRKALMSCVEGSLASGKV